MGKTDYVYPDVADQLTIAIINKLEPFYNYWQESEKRILFRIIDVIKSEKREKASLLDAGCGDGRLLLTFAKYVDSIVCVEPDKKRLEIAIGNSKNLGIQEKCSFVNERLEEFRCKKAFDYIICSHIIQHVSEDSAKIIIAKLSSFLKEDGTLFIMTCHSTLKDDFYVKDFFRTGDIQEENISKEEFEQLAQKGSGALPIHFFTEDNLKRLLAHSGLKVHDTKVFHILGNEPDMPGTVERDDYINSSNGLKQRYGRDIYLQARRK